jgi:hypothetical protein
MAQAIFVEPAIRNSIIKRETSVIDGPGAPRGWSLRELSAAITAGEAEARAACARSGAIEGFDAELVAFPGRAFRNSR